MKRLPSSLTAACAALILGTGTLRAVPVLELSVGDAALVSGGTLDFANPGATLVSDPPQEFAGPEEPVTVSFANISPGAVRAAALLRWRVLFPGGRADAGESRAGHGDLHP
ncbi:MAG: hypothetical protein R3F11_26420 [Verrucomicrobiales bacterium]